jgi:hypothetical protein
MEETSEERIRELGEEYPWVDRLKPQLKGQMVPMPRQDLMKILDRVDWRGDRPYRSTGILLDALLDLGIFRQTNDGRLHVPDIYLYGFGLKRKGGIKRPKRLNRG